MVKKAKERTFHLSSDEIDTKIARFEAKKAALKGAENSTKRKNIIKMILKLKKNKTEGKLFPSAKEKLQKAKSDKMRQMAKKLIKKQEMLAEKKREKNKARRQNCLFCKKYGHSIKECREKIDAGIVSGICYKCGKIDHALNDCPSYNKIKGTPFASCFICKGKGHLSKDCKDNTNGIFYKGGGCHFCGSKMHKIMDCDARNSNAQKQYEFDFDK